MHSHCLAEVLLSAHIKITVEFSYNSFFFLEVGVGFFALNR